MNAQLHLRQAEIEFGVRKRNPIAAGQCQFKSAAQGETMNGRRCWVRQRLEHRADRLPEPNVRQGCRGRLEGGEFANISTSDEAESMAWTMASGNEAANGDFTSAATAIEKATVYINDDAGILSCSS